MHSCAQALKRLCAFLGKEEKGEGEGGDVGVEKQIKQQPTHGISSESLQLPDSILQISCLICSVC